MSDVHTSDGQDRPNVMATTPITTVPSNISSSARIGVLNDIGNAINGKHGAGTVTVIDRRAAYSQTYVTQRINDLSTALNTIGVTPALPIYTSTDYNAFASIVNQMVTAFNALP